MKGNMLKKIVLLFLVSSLVFSLIGGFNLQLYASSETVGVFANVSVSEAKEMVDSNSHLLILDVRTVGEYDGGHIRNAVLIPVSELEGRLGELDFKKELSEDELSVSERELLIIKHFYGDINQMKKDVHTISTIVLIWFILGLIGLIISIISFLALSS